jgi:HEPN domain-containing protein
MYGDEARNLGPEDIFKRADAEEALQLASEVHKLCRSLMRPGRR